MKKDPTIHALLKRLDLPSRNWVIADHWEGDLCAIGIEAKSVPRRLVYVSTWKKPSGKYYFECEVPDGDSPEDYKVVREEDNVDFTALLEVMEEHLD